MRLELAMPLDAGQATDGELYVPGRRPAFVARRRRMRALLLGGLAMVAVAAGAARLEAAFGGVPASVPERRPVPATYLVQPGDTLWSIARGLQPSGDVRPLVRELVRSNGGAELEVGEVLVLP